MKGLKLFEEYMQGGIVKKQNPDKSRAEFLIKESENNYYSLFELLEKIKVDNKNANMFIKSCYDIIMEIIRAKMLLDGYNASGFGSHEAEVAYLKVLGFNEKDTQFVNQLRYFRNGMLYYGTILDEEYAEKVLEFIKKRYPKLII